MEELLFAIIAGGILVIWLWLIDKYRVVPHQRGIRMEHIDEELNGKRSCHCYRQEHYNEYHRLMAEQESQKGVSAQTH